MFDPNLNPDPLPPPCPTGRTGLGVPSSRPTTKLAPEVIAAAAALPLPSTDSFLTRMRSSVDDRRAFGLLKSARRTCEELDRRAGVEDSAMWRDPEERDADERRAKRRKVDDRAEEGEEADELLEGTRPRRKGALGYETGLSATVVDDGEEDEDAKAARDEEDDWFSMDASHTHTLLDWALLVPAANPSCFFRLKTSTRLGLTLAYLRRTYSYVPTRPWPPPSPAPHAVTPHLGTDSPLFSADRSYCLWCGCAYDNKPDLDANCPGELEEEH